MVKELLTSFIYFFSPKGGSTLGMSSAHSHMQQFSITEHFAEQRKVHRNLITSLRGHMKDNAGPGSESDSCDEPEETPSDLSDDEFDSYYFLQVSCRCLFSKSNLLIHRIKQEI